MALKLRRGAGRYRSRFCNACRDERGWAAWCAERLCLSESGSL